MLTAHSAISMRGAAAPYRRTTSRSLLRVSRGSRDRRMNTSSMHADVLIVGAGPTGLVLALWLTRLGIHVRIVDKALEPGTTSRALAVQARTLELYRQLGLASESTRLQRYLVALAR